MILKEDIDVNFDFTTDTKGFWDGFWERNDGKNLEPEVLIQIQKRSKRHSSFSQ